MVTPSGLDQKKIKFIQVWTLLLQNRSACSPYLDTFTLTLIADSRSCVYLIWSDIYREIQDWHILRTVSTACLWSMLTLFSNWYSSAGTLRNSLRQSRIWQKQSRTGMCHKPNVFEILVVFLSGPVFFQDNRNIYIW